MPIQDNSHAFSILKSIDIKSLRSDLGKWLPKSISDNCKDADIERVSALVREKYNFDIWDALMLINLADSKRDFGDDCFDAWRTVYDYVYDIFEKSKIKAHLQDDYPGGNEFLIWASREDFQKIIALIESSNIDLSQSFFVRVIEDEVGSNGNERVIKIS